MALRARDLMTRDPMTVDPGMPLLQVQHLFVMSQISGAPVVDEHGRVLGVISSNDLLRIVDQACDDEIDQVPGADHEDLPERLDALSVRDVATPEAVWVAPDTPIAEVAHVMRAEGIHRVLVGAGARLEGILTAFDLLRAVERREEA